MIVVQSETKLWGGYNINYSSLNYTERQKKLITSSERHSLKSKASEWIIFGHSLAIVLLTKHISKTNVWLSQKGVNWGEIARGHFSKITDTARLPATELGTDKSQYGGYITRHWNWMNSYWMFWIGGLSWRFSVSSFCDFWEMTICDFIAFFSFLAKATLWIFRCAS